MKQRERIFCLWDFWVRSAAPCDSRFCYKGRGVRSRSLLGDSAPHEIILLTLKNQE
ncbi:hypothetical protein PI95_030160 [Hassallia byssoidea VB512170]|uniref:Uncharacterized protein n=1 Tax=Hassallia byssoidea VB512170 TaxID=1304833 RepID=A0A846HIH6_9CYAN|nr:hypothetical protein [Hassalia byssoidea]NEU76659.1 hypothetical protein [Hassalia byssoidea VB512170]